MARPEASAAPQPFILFIADNSPNSRTAVANLHRALATVGRPESDIEIIDVFERPEIAAAERVFVTPALLRRADPRSRIPRRFELIEHSFGLSQIT